MKRIVVGISLGLLAISAVMWAGLLFGWSHKLDPELAFPVGPSAESLLASTKPNAGVAANGAGLTAGQRQEVDLVLNEGTMSELNGREKQDQYLDWLLMTTIAASEPSIEVINRLLFDLPSIRLGYAKPFGNFDYGNSRSRLLSNGIVLALVPAGQSADGRRDTLAAIADEWRKNQGKIFDRMRIVEYNLDANRGRAILTGAGEVAASELFSPKYGYEQQAVASLSDLAAFMAKVDDLTFVSKANSGLTLGGRRMLSRRPGRIEIEQIATIWQSEHEIQAQLNAWDSHVREVLDDVDSRWIGRTYKTYSERASLEAQRDREYEAARARLRMELTSKKMKNGSGFSLDPDVDFVGLSAAFAQVAPNMMAEAPPNRPQISDRDVKLIGSALQARNIVPLLELIDRAGKSSDSATQAMADVFQRLKRSYSFQAARYDGSLQGTEAGMVLFYTDLLAKLWVINFRNSAPIEQIANFLPGTGVALSLIYEQEAKELSAARLWFGQSDRGFQVAAQGNDLLLSRISTRIYAAGNNPLNPGVEVQTSTSLMAPIDWWNDHYAEVARYEPQYERLNEIMKWSIIIGWLNRAHEGDRVGYLAPVPVDRTNLFPDWVAKHPDLKFREWDRIGFYPAGFKGTKTESMPLLSGPSYNRNGDQYTLSGGVSLAPAQIFEGRVAVTPELEALGIARSDLDYRAAGVGRDLVKTFDGTSFRFSKAGVETFDIAAQAKEGTKLRASTVQIASGAWDRTTSIESGAIRFESRADGAPLGDLSITPRSNGFDVGWRARDLDSAATLAKRLSAATDTDAVLRSDPQILSIIKFPGSSRYAVRMNGSKGWVRLAPEDKPLTDLAPGWQARAADPAASRTMQLAIVDDAQLKTEIAKSGHVVLSGAKPEDRLVTISSTPRPPTAKAIRVETDQGRLDVWVDPATSEIHITNVADIASIDGLLRRLGSDEIAMLRAGTRLPSASVKLSDAAGTRGRLLADIEQKQFDQIAREIAVDPVAARKVIDNHVSRELSRNRDLLLADNPNLALQHINGVVDQVGERADLLFQRSLVQIKRSNVVSAAENASAAKTVRADDLNLFFEELAALRRAPEAVTSPLGDNLDRLSEYVDWRAQLSRAPTFSDKLSAVSQSGRFDFELQLAAPPNSPAGPIDFAAAQSGRVKVYYQDVPSLRLDWSNSVDQTLQHVITGKLGRIMQLPRQDIADFNPSVIWTPDHAVAFKSAASNHHIPHVHVGTGSSGSCNGANDNGGASCRPPSAANDNQKVLVVVALEQRAAQ